MSQLILIAQFAVRPHSLEKWKTVTPTPILCPFLVPSGLGTYRYNELLAFVGPGDYSRGPSCEWIRDLLEYTGLGTLP